MGGWVVLIVRIWLVGWLVDWLVWIDWFGMVCLVEGLRGGFVSADIL